MKDDDMHAASKAFTNRLAREKSPYLAQHAHNPVDWYPWGEEAFAKARREDKPIFLSVGYSTCHWCHVMAHESFERREVAQLLNRDFVAIKVDREERPDIDRLYMTYVQAVTRGGGGWPMSVWLTPDLKPFYGGTYFPPEDSYGRPGFLRVLESLAEAWRSARSQIEEAGAETVRVLRASVAAAEDALEPGGAQVLADAAKVFQEAYDPVYGGFSGAPKFPRPSTLAFLLRDHVRTGDKQTLERVLHTLRAMADGGIHDHLGGGFHRYATDERWLVPHFEKMLYDQAQLVCAYLEAYQLTGEPRLAETAGDVLDYVRRDLTGPEGQFYSAEDADSPAAGRPGEAEEGAFYTWTEDDVRGALGEAEAHRFGAAWGLGRRDTLIGDRHVLALSGDGARELLARHRGALLAARARRPRPHCDDKAVTAWNGLMISAFARAYQVLGRDEDRRAAVGAAAFVRRRLYGREKGLLMRRFRDGEAAVEAYAEDYAFLVQGLLDLYEADFDAAHLEWAIELQEQQDARFWDEAHGGYYCSPAGAPDLLVRLKEISDGAEPSANSVAAQNLLRLGAISGLEEYRLRARRIFGFLGRRLREAPEMLPQLLAAYTGYLAVPRQIVIAGERDAADTRALLRAAQRPFHPATVILLADGGAGQALLAQWRPSVREMRKRDGRAAAYVCEGFVCREPITDAEALALR